MGRRAVRLIALVLATLVLTACAPTAPGVVPEPTGYSPGPTLAPPVPSPTATKLRQELTQPTVPNYRSCAQARKAGDVPLKRGRDAGYRRALDRDGDGWACEQ